MLRICTAISILAVYCSALFGGEEKAEGRAIAVVKTWSELAQQPSVELHKNASARFGIQAIRAPRFSGVMLYCLTEAYDPDAEADADDGDRIGPFRLNIRGPEEDDEKAEHTEESKAHPHAKRDYGRLVFGQVISLAKIGMYTVELRDANEVVIASVKVESVDAPFHSWTTLVTSDDDVAQDTELEGVSDGFIRTAAGRAGTPRFDGNVPMLYWTASGARGPRKFDENDPLPTIPDVGLKEAAPLTADQKSQSLKWIASLSSERYDARASATDALFALGSTVSERLVEAARQTNDAESLLRLREVLDRLDGPFHIQMSGMTVMLKTPSFWPTAAIEHYFLARWWVNGKPVPHNEEAEVPEFAEQSGPTAIRGTRFKLQCKPAAIGAKKGDTIRLQLMFCPGGMREVQAELVEPLKAKSAEDDSEAEAIPDLLPLLSNIVEFKVP